MERKRAIALSTIVAGMVVLAAIVFGASSALGSGGGDNVGKLQPVNSPGMTLVVDPATGSATVLPPTTTSARSVESDRSSDDHDKDDQDKADQDKADHDKADHDKDDQDKADHDKTDRKGDDHDKDHDDD